MGLLVLIDNGHGVDTKGKRSPDGRLREYKWAREMAAMVVCRLKNKGMDARLLVPEDNDIPLRERVARVNALCDKYGSKTVLLVSIHNNAAGTDGKWHTASGAEVYVSKNASSNSKYLAKLITEEFEVRGLVGNRTFTADKYKTWSWRDDDIYILKASKCPAVLVENLFMDNVGDLAVLLSITGKEKIANTIVSAIETYSQTQSQNRSQN